MPVSMFFYFKLSVDLPWPSLSNWENTLFESRCIGHSRSPTVQPGLPQPYSGPRSPVDFRSGAAGPEPCSQKLSSLPESGRCARRGCHLLVPDVRGLVVVPSDRWRNFCGQAQPTTSQELPAPCDGLVRSSHRRESFNIEVGAVAGSLARILECRPVRMHQRVQTSSGRLLLALEPRLHGGRTTALMSRMDLSFCAGKLGSRR